MYKDDCACNGKTLSKHVRPAMLAVLASGPTHGYDILQRISDFELFRDDTGPDPSGVYRILKLMEIEGLVSSNWEFGDSGPARRQFTITDEGVDCLRHWVETLSRYRSGLGELLGVMEHALREPSR